MKIDHDQFRSLTSRMSIMEREREPWWTVWREVSDFFLPRRYPWLQSDKERTQKQVRNTRLLDSTSTIALRTLATGMMNGITSPARPWFRLGVSGKKQEELSYQSLVWLEESTKLMLRVMAGTNFYNAIGILYLEWAAFGTASMGIYEDFDAVFRCRNFALGEFYVGMDADGKINRHARRFNLTVEQTVEKFGIENVPERVRNDFKAGQQRLANQVKISCLIEPNDPARYGVRASAKYRELYWVEGPDNELLAARPYEELPTITPRWETYADDSYGTSPCVEAIPDVIQLQHLIKRRAQGLDKTISPPMLAHTSLASKPKAFQSGGVTYVSAQDLQHGARPAFTVTVPFQELALDIIACQRRIEETLFNDLFKMITNLDTVRSATEIDARREEKLVLLGPVLERFEAEGLEPCITRIFNICLRAGIFSEPPKDLEDADISIQYVSMLSDAQRAVGTVSVERWLQLIGNVSQMYPDAIDIPDWDELIRDYADDIGVKKQHQKPREVVEELKAARQQQETLRQAAESGQQLASGAQSLSQTDVGGGQNALQAILG